MRFGILLSKITTPLIMGVIFFLLITPFGFVLRLAGKDSLSRKYEESAPSYRVKSIKPEKESLEKPF